jgi:hypothetical protein
MFVVDVDAFSTVDYERIDFDFAHFSEGMPERTHSCEASGRGIAVSRLAEVVGREVCL